jgi:DNA modification methylase
MPIVADSILSSVSAYCSSPSASPLYLLGDAVSVLADFPDECVDVCLTSPPYWGKRQYRNGGIGLETAYEDYIANLVAVFALVKRVLKPTGSFWLNLGDTYLDKHLLGLPWRVALTLIDHQGWILRNSVIWNKVKGGPDNTLDRLRNVHEHIFHFVKIPRGYYYNTDEIRSTPQQAKIVNGAVISATGVRGVSYRRQIELSTALSEQEKQNAWAALEEMLGALKRGEIADFRMVIRKQQRATHSDDERVSGRARELHDKGFYFLKYHPSGSKPGDVWDILPEDTQGRSNHFAAFPEDLCKIPIRATCPPQGIVLDPFCGTGTTCLVAQSLERKSIGIDISQEYLDLAERRTRRLL